jgi:uncharacterized membrane protein YgdD (TMEM256/DUF423 family)
MHRFLASLDSPSLVLSFFIAVSAAVAIAVAVIVPAVTGPSFDLLSIVGAVLLCGCVLACGALYLLPLKQGD